MMMKNNASYKTVLTQSVYIIRILLVVISGLGLSACGGGISGTGDGGPVIIQPDGTMASTADTSHMGSADSGDGASETTDGGATGGMGQVFLQPQLSSYLPATIVGAATRPNGNRNSEAFIQALFAATNELETYNRQILNDQANDRIEQIDGFFDRVLRTAIAGTESVLKWSDDGAYKYQLHRSADKIIHILDDNGRITLRRTDLTTNTILQAILQPANTEDIAIEAVLNVNGTLSYLQSLSSAEEAVFLIEHPTDSEAISHREIIDSSGTLLTSQSCTPTTSDSCQNQSSGNWLVNNTADSNIASFESAAALLNQAASRTTSPVNNLPTGINTAVLSATEDENQVVEALQCGLQVRRTQVRSFCVQPEQTGVLYQEILSGGQAFYPRLP